VKAAKDMNINRLSSAMFTNENEIPPRDLSQHFASHFDDKVMLIEVQLAIDKSVFDGTRKIIAETECFMNLDSLRRCLKSLKMKNCEGYDPIPQRILINVADDLLAPLVNPL
jgi:hypothetical protein